MSLNAYALTTVARFKSFKGITVNTDDTRIEQIINIVSDYVEKYCDRRFKQTAYTNEVYDGNGWNQMLLKQYPISTTATFQLDVRDTDLNEAKWSAIDTNMYHIDYTAGMIEYFGRFAEVPRKYQVTYTAGYNFDNVAGTPTLEAAGIGDLEYAVWVIVDNIYTKRGQTGGIKSESIGNYSVTYGDYALLDNDIKMILNKYKRPHSM